MAMFIENPLKSIMKEGDTKTFITAIRETIKSFGCHKKKTIHPLTAYASQVLFECIIGFDYEWNLHKNYRLEDFITVISLITQVIKEQEMTLTLYQNELLQKLNNDLFQDYERSLLTKTKQLNTCEEEKRKLEVKQTLQLQQLKVQQLFPHCKFIAIDKPSSYSMLSNDKKNRCVKHKCQ